MIKCEACQSNQHLFATSFINSIIQEHECMIELRPLDNENMKFWRSVKKSEKMNYFELL